MAHSFLKRECISNAQPTKSQSFGKDGVEEFKGTLLNLWLLVDRNRAHALIVTHQRSAEIRRDHGCGFDPQFLVVLDECTSKGTFSRPCWSTEDQQRAWRNANGCRLLWR